MLFFTKKSSRHYRNLNSVVFFLSLVLVVCAVPSQAERLKDITSVSGVRSNALVGYGLVVGLNGSGDKTPFTDQTFVNMMNKMGITIPAGIDPKLKNIAAVSIHADLPAFAKPGQTIDVTVSSIGNAKSLRGGSLLLTPLKAVDGQVYALSQGNLIVGGFDAGGADGSRITVNIPSTGRIPNGAMVEKVVPTPFYTSDSIIFNLDRSDFTTAKRVTDQINDYLGPNIAQALDSTSIKVSAPKDPNQRVMFLSVLENLKVIPGEAGARVIINSRTGTIVIGQHVKVAPAAITHGSLTVTITEQPEVVQPEAFSEGGVTAIVPRTNVQVDQSDGHMFLFGPGVSLSTIVQAVNQVGAAPSDLMAILEALKQAGALKADLIVI
ncbi:MAG: flagellar basal body P-ring protein FlgI [Pseudomonadales bacterium]|jgi:flagellar P-ring protein precursor FlgI|nr:flagellar basal body P-ring protein FlgI [Pseudomonadales bacterium]